MTPIATPFCCSALLEVDRAGTALGWGGRRAVAYTGWVSAGSERGLYLARKVKCCLSLSGLVISREGNGAVFRDAPPASALAERDLQGRGAVAYAST